jgi:serine protease Do
MTARLPACTWSPRLTVGCCLVASLLVVPVILLLPDGSALGQSSPQSASPQKAGVDVTRQVQSNVSIPLPSLSPLVERVAPAVVNVSVVMSDQDIAAEGSDEGPGNQATPFDEFLRRFFEQQGLPNSQQRRRPQPRAGRAMALGSGFIIDPEGDIVTNNHVVGNSDTVTVSLPDSSKHPARVLGRDERIDLALLKIDSDRPLPFVSWGDSDAAKVGDWVVAVGNPFGLGGTVTSGIISALGRNIEAGPYDDFLQIDASINRGNSGGPTFDLAGQVIGINTAIYSPSGGSVGIGFAVPSNLARNVVAQLKQKGHVTRGWLGAQVQSLTPEIAKGLGLSPESTKGALVADVVPNSPAAKAGLKQGDVITHFDGKEVKDVHDLPRLVAETLPGQKVDLTVRRGGKEQHVTATIAELKDQPQRAAAGGGTPDQARPQRSSALGMRLSPLTEDVRTKTGVPSEVNGVVIIDVAPDSVAAGLVEPGDVIVSVNQQPVSSPADAAAKLREGAAQKQVLLVLDHGGTNHYVGLPID